MAEASQRSAQIAPMPAPPGRDLTGAGEGTKTANLQALCFQSIANLSQALPPARRQRRPEAE